MFIERPPWFYRKLFPGSVWRLPAEEPCVYITFDDGPNAATTPRLLRLLDQLAVPATFFCVGDNVRRYPEAYRAILASGHTVGNHTYHHIRGFRLPASDYMADVRLAAKLIDSPLFRPPHGRLLFTKSGEHFLHILIVESDGREWELDYQLNVD